MKVNFGDTPINEINHEFLKENQFDVLLDAVEAMKIIDYYTIEKLLSIQDIYGLETEELVNIIGYDLGVESLNIPINAYNYEIINYLGAGLEGVPTDIIKTGWRATKGTVKAVRATHKAIYKNAKQMSAKWNTNIKPLIMKFLKEFQAQLQIMWGKFRKYDKLYTKLGREINSVLNVYGKQMNTMRSMSIFYHQFNPNALRGYAEAIKDYEAFMGSITGSSELFGGNFVPPKEFAGYLKSRNLAKAKACVDSMSEGMSKLNSRGDLAFAYAIINDSDKNLSKSNFRKIREFFTGPEPEAILKAAIKNKSPLVEFVQVSILRKEIEGKYNEKTVAKFKNDMLGNSGFLTIMNSILNNKVIEKVLTGGGNSIKEQTKEDITAMEDIVRTAAQVQEAPNNNNNTFNSKVEAEKQEKARQSSEVTGSNNNTKGSALEQEVNDAQNNTKTMKDGNLSEVFNPFGYEPSLESNNMNHSPYRIKDPHIKEIYSHLKTAKKIVKLLIKYFSKTEYSKYINKYTVYLDEEHLVSNMELDDDNNVLNFKLIEWDFDDFEYKYGYAKTQELRNVFTKKLEELVKRYFPHYKYDLDAYDLVFFISNEEGTEGLVDFIKGYFRKSPAIQKAEAKKNNLTTPLTVTEYKKAVEKFFIDHKKILDNMLKPYKSALKKYDVRVEVGKYIEYEEIDDDSAGYLNIFFNKSLNFADDYNDPDGEEVARIIGIHPDGSDKFGPIIKKAFKDKFGFDIEVDGGTREVMFATPWLDSITFKEESGNESDTYFSDFFNQDIYSPGLEKSGGLADAMGYTADRTSQKTEANAASTDKISTDPNEGEMGPAELADAYIQSYSILMSKATAAYSSMVKGFLAAAFTLCKEANTIVNEIYSATGANREATNNAVQEDKPRDDEEL